MATDQETTVKDTTNVTDIAQSQPVNDGGSAGADSSTGGADGTSGTVTETAAAAQAPAAETGSAAPAESAAPVVQQKAATPVQQQEVTKAAPTPAPTQAPKATAAPKAAPQPQVQQQTQQQAVILSARAQAYFEDLQAYIDEMDPKKPANAKRGPMMQARLYRIIQNIINNLQEDFRPAFVTLLQKFEEHGKPGGVFHPLNAFRYFQSVPLGDEDRAVFRNLLNMLTKLAPPKSRGPMLGQINMQATLDTKAITEAGRQRVNSFFGR